MLLLISTNVIKSTHRVLLPVSCLSFKIKTKRRHNHYFFLEDWEHQPGEMFLRWFLTRFYKCNHCLPDNLWPTPILLTWDALVSASQHMVLTRLHTSYYVCESGQVTYPEGLNFLIYKKGIYNKDIFQRLVVRINEIIWYVLSISRMLSRVYLFVPIIQYFILQRIKRVYERIDWPLCYSIRKLRKYLYALNFS